MKKEGRLQRMETASLWRDACVIIARGDISVFLLHSFADSTLRDCLNFLLPRHEPQEHKQQAREQHGAVRADWEWQAQEYGRMSDQTSTSTATCQLQRTFQPPTPGQTCRWLTFSLMASPFRLHSFPVVLPVLIGVVTVIVGFVFVLVGVASAHFDGVQVLLPSAHSRSSHAHRPY